MPATVPSPVSKPWLLLSVAILAASPCRSDAQDNASPSADSLAFRRGQWGAIVGLDRQVATVGVLRFRSPRTAWVANASAGAVIGTTDAGTSETETDTENSGFTGRLGLRRYRPVETRVAAYSGAGVSAGASFSEQASASGYSLTSRTLSAGLYGELGIQYRVTRYLALGVASEANVAGLWGTLEQRPPAAEAQRSRTRAVSASLGALRVLGTMYF